MNNIRKRSENSLKSYISLYYNEFMIIYLDIRFDSWVIITKLFFKWNISVGYFNKIYEKK